MPAGPLPPGGGKFLRLGLEIAEGALSPPFGNDVVDIAAVMLPTLRTPGWGLPADQALPGADDR